MNGHLNQSIGLEIRDLGSLVLLIMSSYQTPAKISEPDTLMTAVS